MIFSRCWQDCRHTYVNNGNQVTSRAKIKKETNKHPALNVATRKVNLIGRRTTLH